MKPPKKPSLPTELWMNCSFDCRFDTTGVHATGCEPFQVPQALGTQLARSREQADAGRDSTRERRAAQPDFFETASELTELFAAELPSDVSTTQLAAKLAGAVLAGYEIKKRPTG